MKIFSGLVVLILMMLMSGLLLWAGDLNRKLIKENTQLREEVQKYSNGVFLGMNKGGYTITFGDDGVAIKCSVLDRFHVSNREAE